MHNNLVYRCKVVCSGRVGVIERDCILSVMVVLLLNLSVNASECGNRCICLGAGYTV